MAYKVPRVRWRSRIAGSLALVALSSPAVCGALSNFRSIANALPGQPAFEEDNSARGAYTWRNQGIVAACTKAGMIALQLPNAKHIGLSFDGAAPQAVPQGEHPLPLPVNYYVGPPTRWHSRSAFAQVRYRDLYPGVDLVLITNAGQLEYNLEARPFADLHNIRIRYNGGAPVLNAHGDLEIRAGAETVRQHRPLAFQDGGKSEVKCSYSLGRSGRIAFRCPGYDPSKPLLIDPVLSFSTYLGGTSFDAAYASASDLAGNMYITGETSSGSIPGGNSTRASRDVWVAKLDSTGTHLLYLTYAGGSGNDVGKGIAIDAAGNAYVTGYTASSDFPTTIGALSTRNTGAEDAFVLKLDPNGRIVYSTYLGGASSDHGLAIAVDPTGAAFVAGQTGSVPFPTTPRAIQTSYRGGLSDCFVSKLNPSGSALLYSTYLGGQALDLCSGIAIDSTGNAYVTGTTYSADFPTQAPLQGSLQGTANAFVAKINPSGSALLYSTFLGGSVVDNGNAIAVDSSGSAYIAGCTSSPNFPTSVGAAQTALAGAYNAFAAKLSSSGNSLAYSTLVGGSGSDNATAIAVDSLGQAVLGGYTSSSNFPLATAIQPAFHGAFDAFATVVNPAGTGLVFSSYFGGGGDDRAYGVAAVSGSKVYLAGMTSSADFPTSAAVQNSLSGSYDAFALGLAYPQTASTAGLAFYSLTPCRIADTRSVGGSGKTGAFGPPYLSGGSTRDFPIPASSCNVPSTAQAYSLNVTVVPRTVLGQLKIWPSGQPMPITMTLAASAAQIVANAAIAAAGANGAISMYVSNDTDVIIDINGYFAPPGPQGMVFYPLTPCRVVDTRSSGGSGNVGAFGPPQLRAGASRSFPFLSSPCGIPSAAQAYSVNMTVVPPKSLFYLTTWPTGQPIPWVATLNDLSGAILANAAIVPAGNNGAISVFVSDATDVIIDINGYFAPPGGPQGYYFYTVPPCRVVDTRASGGMSGAFGPPQLTSGSTRSFPVPSSSCNVPGSAQAYSLSLAVIPPRSMFYLTVWPSGEPIPWVATLNDLSGWVVANAALVPAGTGGAVSVYVYNTTDLLMDINGYFGP